MDDAALEGRPESVFQPMLPSQRFTFRVRQPLAERLPLFTSHLHLGAPGNMGLF